MVELCSQLGRKPSKRTQGIDLGYLSADTASQVTAADATRVDRAALLSGLQMQTTLSSHGGFSDAVVEAPK